MTIDCTIVTVACANVATMTRTFAMIKDLKHTNKWLVLDNNYSEKSSNWLAINEGHYGYKLLQTPHGKNIGLHNGFNLCLAHVETSHVLGIDPDMFLCSRGFDTALLAHAADRRNVIVQAFMTYPLTEMRGPKFERGDAGWLIIPDHPVIMGMCMWQVEWLRQCGGLQEPSEFYGGLECMMWQYLDQKEKRWVRALNAIEGWKDLMPGLEDPWFLSWKRDHAHKGDKRGIEEYRREYNELEYMCSRECK
jgi:hypothetical protein